MRSICAGFAIVLVLAACNRENSSDAPSLADGKAWALDACRTFPAAAAAKAIGAGVTAASAGARSAIGGNQVSTCNYTAAGQGPFTVLLRQQGEGGGGIAQTIAGLHSQPDITGPVTEIAAGAEGAKAFWTPRHSTLTYAPDDKRVVVVTPPGATGGGTGAPPAALQKTALAIARAAAASRP
jgi:hypothetical protein